MKTVYELYFGMGAYGKIEMLSNGKYQCFETPRFGGSWMAVGGEYDNINDAITFINSLT